MQNSVAKKIFAVGSAVAMSLAAFAPLAAIAAVHADGTQVSDSNGTVYMIISGQRRPYTSAGAFTSYGFNSFASVVSASAEDLALPVGSFIPPQDGSIVCSDRGADKGTCYEISNGQKFGFTSAAIFAGLGFSFKNSVNGDVSFMPSGSSLINSTTLAHLPGTLVNNGGTVQLIGNTSLLGVPDLATFNSWGYSFAKVVPANAADKTWTQSGVFAARLPGQLSPSWTTNPGCTTNCGTPVVNGSVSVSLSSDNPAAGTVVANSNATSPGQTGADLAHFTFTGSGTVTQLVVNRIGVSADNSVSNVYLYQGNSRITSAGTFSNGAVTFSNSNGLFTVSGPTTIMVKADIAAGATSGQTLGAQLASYTVANGSAVSASISGNLFNIASVSNLATAQISGSGNSALTSSGANGGTAGTINAGTMNAILWSVPVSIGQRTVLLKHIAFTQIGSIQAGSITGLQLYVDGAAQSVTPTMTTAGGQSQVVFDMPGSPVSLSTGSHIVSLQGNIVAGTSYNYSYTLQTSADAVFFDTNYNVNIPVTYSGGAAVFQLTPGVTTINSGTVSIQSDPAYTATQFVSNSSGVNLGQWLLTAYGENVNVNQLKIQLVYTGTFTATTTDGFNNLALYVNGGSVGSSQSALLGTSSCTGLTCTYSFGTTNLFTIRAGSPVTVSVKGDSTMTGTDISSVQATLITPASAFQGATSFALTPVTQQTYAANSLTTGGSTGTLSLNNGLTNSTIGSNQSNQLIGSYVIQAGSNDGIRLNSVTVGFASTTSLGGNTLTSLTNMYVTVVPGQSASGTPTFTSTPVNPQTTNSFTLNNVIIPVSSSAVINVYANISNITGTVATTLYATAQGSTSNNTISGTGFSNPSPTSVTGQTQTVGNGTLGINTALNGASPVAQFVVGGSTLPIAVYNATSTSGVSTISELDFQVSTAGTATADPITQIQACAVVSGTGPGCTTWGAWTPVTNNLASATSLNIAVPTGSVGINIPVNATYASVTSPNGVPSNQSVTLNLVYAKYLSGSSTQYRSANVASNNVVVVGSIPTVTLAAVNGGHGLTAGSVSIGQVTVAANSAGQVILANLPISVSTFNATISGTVSLVDTTASSQVAASTTGFTVNNGASATTTIVFIPNQPNTNTISPGSPHTYNVVVNVTAVSSTNGTPSVTLQLGSPYFFQWNDVNGNVQNIRSATTPGGNALIPSYTTFNSVSLQP